MFMHFFRSCEKQKVQMDLFFIEAINNVFFLERKKVIISMGVNVQLQKEIID